MLFWSDIVPHTFIRNREHPIIMDIRLDNYSANSTFRKGILLFLLAYMTASQVIGQQACPIRTAVEPKKTSNTRSAATVAEVPFPYFASWNSISDLRVKDQQYATVSLAGYKRSTLLKASGLPLDIPANAHINGLRLTVTGRSTGTGAIAETDVRLTMGGIAQGENKAETAGLAAWATSEQDVVWSYGGEYDTWGLDLTEEMLSSLDFGYQLQIRNRLSGQMDVSIDDITMTVYYTPLYTICDHDCVTYYVDSLPSESITYNWLLPEGYELLSYSEHAGIINVGVYDAVFGTYEICVETLEDDVVTGLCCREFNYEDCNPASIGDQVWQDQNANAILDSGDLPIANVPISLFDSGDNLIANTTSDADGMYAFAGVTAGDYYLVVDAPQGLTPVVPGIGSADTDSDLTGANGTYSTDLIVVAAGDSITNLDLGFSEQLFFGDLVWEDIDGDGTYQVNEPGIADVSVTVTSTLGVSQSTVTGDDGSYLAGPFPTGTYTLQYTAEGGLIPTLQSIGAATTDSDIDATGTTSAIAYLQGGFVDSIDAGYYTSVVIGDFVWLDDNFNGLQDEGESGLQGINVRLLTATGTVVDSMTTDSTGTYEFTVAPGTYKVQASNTRQYIPTVAATDSLLDSNLQSLNGIFETAEITLLSGEVRTDIDLGFVDQPTDIGGTVWSDDLADGQRTDDEPGIAAIEVSLYRPDGTLESTTTTDSIGDYSFLQINAGMYYITYDIGDTQLSTIPDVGDDATDSDVTGSVTTHSTDIFAVVPGVNDFSIWAGITNKPSVGDQVWVDLNRDGLLGDSELGVNGLTVRLLNSAGDTVATALTSTDAATGRDGYYLFENLDLGDYQVQFEVDTFFIFTTSGATPDELNSDVTQTSVMGSTLVGSTEIFAVERNENNTSIDAGILLPLGGIAGVAFVDSNADSINNDNVPLPDVLVSLYTADDVLVDSTRTDLTGAYIFPLLMDGSYYVEFSRTDRYRFTGQDIPADDTIDSDVSVDDGRSGIVSVSAVSIPIIDAGYLDGQVPMSGTTWIDDNGDGIRQATELPLGDVQVLLYLADGTGIDTTVTDAAGQYQLGPLDEGDYYIVFAPSDSTLVNTTANQGADDTIDDDVTNSIATGSTDTISVTYFADENNNVDAGYYQLATVGDLAWIDLNDNSIRDADEAGLDGIVVNLLDVNDNVIATTTTAAGGGLDSGYYQLDMIPPGEYRLQFTRVLFFAYVDADTGPDDTDSDAVTVDGLDATTDFFSLTSGQVDNTRDVGLEASAPMESSISGTLWDDLNANGIRDADEPVLTENVQVQLQDQTPGSAAVSTSVDENGMYLFDNLGEGNYRVTIELPKTYTVKDAGNDDTIDSDFSTNEGSGIINLGIFEDVVLDCGQTEHLYIGQNTWEDLNVNGIRDADEPPVQGVSVSATSIIGAATKSDISDENGRWHLDLPASVYDIVATAPDGYFFTTPDIGDDDFDSDIGQDGTLLAADFTAGGTITNFDIGVVRAGTVSGEVWIDFNANGRQGLGEPGFEAVAVTLYDAVGLEIATTTTSFTTDGEATYTFADVFPGEYYVEFTVPVEYLISDANQGNEDQDSDITGSNGLGTTDLFLVGSGADVTAIDGGLYLPATIGDRVWFDDNMDGIQDPSEPGIADIEVILYRSFGLPIDTTYTDSDGAYSFDLLQQGLYFIGFEVPEMFVVSPMDIGNDEALDSDSDESGTTPLISLAHGTELLDVDCGLFQSMSSLRSTAWEDINGDGLRQMHEPRIADVRIELMDNQGLVIDSTYTNSLGKYAFEAMPVGDYYIHVDLQDFNFEFTTANMGDDYLDSDIMPSGDSQMFAVTDSLSVPNIDIGLFHMGQLVMNVWHDSNANSNQDANEEGVADVLTEIYMWDGTLAYEVMSAPGRNNVIVEDMAPGMYFAALMPPEGYEVGSELDPDADMYHQTNSDLILTDEGYETPLFLVSSGADVRYIDAGFRAENQAIITSDDESNDAVVIDVSVGPNPALLYVQLEDVSPVPITGTCTVTLTDRDGSLISQQITDRLTGYTVPLTDVKSGVYYLTVEHDGAFVTKKLLKITP